jgi:hypothetical protein
VTKFADWVDPPKPEKPNKMDEEDIISEKRIKNYIRKCINHANPAFNLFFIISVT